MINKGYSKTNKILKDVFANGIEDYEYVYQKIEERKSNTNCKLRITGDTTVTNINKITQKLAKRKIEI